MPNPGPMGRGFVILNEDRVKIGENSIAGGIGTNNKAEYSAIRDAITAALLLGDSMTIYSDSMLIVNQVNGVWKPTKNPGLKPIYQEVMDLLSKVKKWSLVHVKAHNGDEWNEYVDQLAKNAVLNS